METEMETETETVYEQRRICRVSVGEVISDKRGTKTGVVVRG